MITSESERWKKVAILCPQFVRLELDGAQVDKTRQIKTALFYFIYLFFFFERNMKAVVGGVSIC